MIILQYDDKYHHWGLLMVRSLALHEPDKRVLLDTVNLSPAQVSELGQAHPRVIVENDTTSGQKTSPEQMVNRKPFVMQKAMDAYPDEPWYGLFDADFLVRRSLPDLWSKLDDHPAALIMTSGKWRGRYYRRLVTPSGIVLVRPDGRLLIDNWAKWHAYDKPLGEIEPRQWYWDQLTLLQARNVTSLRYATISMGVFANSQLSPRAAIWSANVRYKKRYYERFQKEYKRQGRTRQPPHKEAR